METINDMAQQRYGATIPNIFRYPWRDGDVPNTAGNISEHEAGHWVFKLKSKYKPIVYDENDLLISESSIFHSGCRAQAQIWIVLYDQKTRKGAMIFFDQVKKLGPGKRFASFAQVPTPEIFNTPQNAQLLQQFSQVFMKEKTLDDERPELPFGRYFSH